MNATQLIQFVKDRAGFPPSQVAVTDATILGMATEELQAYIAPLLASVNEEFFTDSEDVSLAAGQAAYDIPLRAMGTALRAIKYVDASGNEGSIINRVELTDIGMLSISASTVPAGIYATATRVVVLPTPTVSSGKLRFYYSRRPGSLVATPNSSTQGNVAIVTVVSSDITVVVTNIATSIFTIGATVDVVSANPPFKLKARDLIITAVGVAFITIGAGGLTAAGVAVGDYFTIANTSYVPQIPPEWHSLLELRTAARLLTSIGDPRGTQIALRDAAELERRLVRLAAPRFASNPRKLNAWR